MSDDYEYQMEVFLDPDRAEDVNNGADVTLDQSAALQRLKNLGYGTGEPLNHQVMAFQRDCGLAETGAIGDILDELNQRHDQCNPPLRINPNE